MAENITLESISKKLDVVAGDVRSNTYRIDRLEQKFDGIEKKFDGIEKKFDGIEKKFEGLERKFDILTDVVREVADGVKLLSGQFNSVASKTIEHEVRLNTVEKRVDDLEATTH
ncbi:MAG: hypothetical protein QM785_06765 [Pyrinomonadaceae bacterium]